MKVINTAECMGCKYCKLDESNISLPQILCNYRDKQYHWGQRVPCEDFEKKEEVIE